MFSCEAAGRSTFPAGFVPHRYVDTGGKENFSLSGFVPWPRFTNFASQNAGHSEGGAVAVASMRAEILHCF